MQLEALILLSKTNQLPLCFLTSSYHCRRFAVSLSGGEADDSPCFPNKATAERAPASCASQSQLVFTQLKTVVTELHIYSAVHNILLIFIIVKSGLLTVTLL